MIAKQYRAMYFGASRGKKAKIIMWPGIVKTERFIKWNRSITVTRMRFAINSFILSRQVCKSCMRTFEVVQKSSRIEKLVFLKWFSTVYSQN